MNLSISTLLFFLIPSLILYSSNKPEISTYVPRSIIVILTNQTDQVESISLNKIPPHQTRFITFPSPSNIARISVEKGKTKLYVLQEETYSKHKLFLDNRKIIYNEKNPNVTALLFVTLMQNNIIRLHSPLDRIIIK